MANIRDLDTLIGTRYPDADALRRAVEGAGGFVVDLTHFEMKAINSNGRTVQYRLAEDAQGVAVAGRIYDV